MLTEKDFEDIIVKYPELIESALKLIGRQISIFGRRIDILFEDQFKRKLIIELKNGPIKDEHIGQILSYEGMIISYDDPSVRVMLIGTRVPPNLQRSLDHHGIAWKEISHSKLKEFLVEKQDNDFVKLFNDENQVVFEKIDKPKKNLREKSVKPVNINIVSKKIGIKIFKGAGPTDNNLNVSLRNEIDLENITGIIDHDLKQHLLEFKKNNESIYAWALLSGIQKKAFIGMKIFFVIEDSNELLVFDYLNSFFDQDSQFQKFVKWKGHGFEKIVFLKNKEESHLSNEQIEKIKDLTDAKYIPFGKSKRYKYKEILCDENVEKFINIINNVQNP